MYVTLPASLHSKLIGCSNFVLLETSKYDDCNLRSYLFINPVTMIKIFSVQEVPYLFQQIEEYVNQGYYLAGYVSYECGYHFEKVFSNLNVTLDYPIAWFGVYERPIVFNHRNGEFENHMFADDCKKKVIEEYKLHNLAFNFPYSDYIRKTETIKDYISQGDVYQINFTGKYTFTFSGSATALYDSLKKKQNVPYSALIDAEGLLIVSLSPELFFRLKRDKIITRPMKGTAQRGRTLTEDEVLKEALKNDEKNRAENLMIVDLLRNDVGRISKPGSVHVRELFCVERYQTLFQMTSTIEGNVREDLNFYDLFRAIFPGGSVTGAPKIRSMEIIHELETEPRGVYTGSIGFISPQREAVFNIAIRTVVIRGEKGEMGTGSGIVWDSDPEAEYEECKLKANFLTTPYEEFELLETMLFRDGYFLLEKHLERLKRSAQYFDYPFDEDAIRSALKGEIVKFEGGKKYKVRLRLNRDRDIFIESSLLEQGTKDPNLVMISYTRTNSHDTFLYHKTTKRGLYDTVYREALHKGFIEAIFMNEKGQVTEGAISNILIRKGQHYYTPPVECGLLNGVYRQYLFETLPNVEEKILSMHDLQEADALFICNSVREMQEVEINNP